MKHLVKAVAVLAVLTSCSKSGSDPEVFVPRILSPQGEDLKAAHDRACDPSKVNFSDSFLTTENFQAMFSCANYDHSLNDLEPLFTSKEFPQLLSSVNLVLKSDNAKPLKQTLNDWLEAGPGGTSRVDRLLPFLSSLIKNPSFQAGLPVLSNILQAGQQVWADLLPSLADVVYTDLFPKNLEDVFAIFKTFSSARDNGAPRDYATGIKTFATFLETPVDGQSAAMRALALIDDVKNLQPSGTSLYQFAETALETGAIDDYFLNSGSVRGEAIDPKLNSRPDDVATACPGLNDSPEHRQSCASIRLWRRGPNGAEAPITQLVALVAELENDHPELLPSLASWFLNNGSRVEASLSAYVVRAQVITKLSEINVGTYLTAYARKNAFDLTSKVTGAQFADFLRQAFASVDYVPWIAGFIPQINKEAFGTVNAAALAGNTLAADIATIYQAPEVAEYALKVIPGDGTAALSSSINKFSNKHRGDAVQVPLGGKTQSVEKHMGDLWATLVKSTLGDDLVMNYVIRLAQNFATQAATDFKNKGQPFAEWYFDSPYGNPATTEMIVGYAITELDLLGKYYQNKDWLMNDFTNEAFTSDYDKALFRQLLEQVPNLVTYVRSGMARSGSDFTRAVAKDSGGYMVKTYVNLIVKASSTGWINRAARLMEAYQAMPEYKAAARAFRNDDIGERRDIKLGVEALDRIVRSLTQPEVPGDYTTTTLSRLLQPFGSIVGESRRKETEQLLHVSAAQLLGLTDQQINDFMRDLSKAKPDTDPGARLQAYKSVADLMWNGNAPALLIQLSALFQENAVKPALSFFATKIDDGSLPKVLVMIRRLLGIGT